MEEKNRVPNNLKRRYILAKLLDIPFALFGLAALETCEQLTHALPKKQGRVDLERYRLRLSGYWNQHYTNTAADIVEEVMECIYHIHDELPYSSAQPQLLDLLCGYHLVLANILRDLQYNKHATIHLNKAYRLAKILNKPVLQAVVLYRRGWVCCDEENFPQAINDFETANTLLTRQNAAPQLFGSLQLGIGHARMYRAQSSADLLTTMRFMDSAQQGIDNGEDDFFYASTPNVTILTGRQPCLGHLLAIVLPQMHWTIWLLRDNRTRQGIPGGERIT